MSLPPLKVKIGADTSELEKKLGATQAKMLRFAKVAAAAGAAVAAAMGVLARRSMTAIDAQAKLAQSLNTTTKSIQVLSRAGELAGVSMSGIEQATKDLTRRLSQAASGTGPAVKALDRLGLSANYLAQLPLDERVMRINSAIQEFIPAAEQAAIAGQLFGEEGSIAMSRIDTETLRQATQDIKDFGVAVSEQDAEQIERTNDAISRLSLIWEGLGNRIAVQIAPAMERLADIVANLTKVTSPLSQALAAVFERIPAYASTIGALGAVLAGKFVAGLVAAKLATAGLSGALVFLRGALIRTGIGALIVLMGEAVFRFQKLSQAAGGFGEALSAIGEVFGELLERFRMGLNLTSELFAGLGLVIQGAFMKAFGVVETAWVTLQNKIASGINVLIEGMNNAFNTNFDTVGMSESSNIGARGDDIMSSGQQVMQSAAGGLMDLSGPLEGVQKIRDLLAKMKEEGTTLPDILGAPTGGVDGAGAGATGGGGGGGGAGNAVDPITESIQGQIDVLKNLKQQGRDTWAALGTFIQQFAGKSKAAAIAAIAIQKGLSIAQIISNTAAAQMRAIAEFGWVAGAPIAAKIGALGKIQAGLVAATGLAQAASAAGSGGSGGGGGGAGAAGGGAAAQPAVQDSLAVNLSVQGRGDLVNDRGAIDAFSEVLLENFRDRGITVVRA